jgi:hypothetical protein
MKGRTMKAVAGNGVILGVGVLNWNRSERVSDRYGFVYLLPGSGGYLGALSSEKEPVATEISGKVAASLAGKRGKLVAHVLKTRRSGHIGDLFRSVFPVTPKVGERIVLGTGTFMVEIHKQGDEPEIWVGLEPEDGRQTCKLNVKALYRAHDQTVRLEFVEG